MGVNYPENTQITLPRWITVIEETLSTPTTNVGVD